MLNPPADLTEDALAAALARGWNLEASALELYRLRWDVADLAAYAAQFAGPHADGRNEAAAWGYMRKLMKLPPTRDAAG